MAQVTLVDHTENPVEKIGKFAAICYDSDVSSGACIKRAKSCLNKGHLATLRFAYATFKIEGISRACSHQLVRSKHLDYLQESQRYVNQGNCEFVQPEVTDKCKVIMTAIYDDCIKTYETLIDCGVKKEDARYVLPQAATTKLYVTGNFQAWKDFINLRSGKEVQWEIRAVAQEINRQLGVIAPEIFGEQNVT
jgi:thymidylate synthase (FAD)